MVWWTAIPGKPGEGYFESKHRILKNLKNLVLLVIHGASASFGKNLISEQEVLNNIADMIMEIYLAESLALRIEKMESLKGEDPSGVYRAMLDVFIYDAADKVRKSAADGVNSFADGAGRVYIPAIDPLTRVDGINVKEARRRIAARLIEENSYKF